MARPSHLIRRGARYYFRLSVPADLRPILGRREVLKSLGTADYSLALDRLAAEAYATRKMLQDARSRLRTDGTATLPVYLPPVIERHSAPHPLVATTSERTSLLPAVSTPHPSSSAEQGVTLYQLSQQFLKELEKAGKAPKTLISYEATSLRCLGQKPRCSHYNPCRCGSVLHRS